MVVACRVPLLDFRPGRVQLECADLASDRHTPNVKRAFVLRESVTYTARQYVLAKGIVPRLAVDFGHFFGACEEQSLEGAHDSRSVC